MSKINYEKALEKVSKTAKEYTDKQQITDTEIDEAFVENGISSEEMYKITYDLRGMAKISSNMNTIYKNACYYARVDNIDRSIEKPVTVTMGGVDITSTSYKDGGIIIDSVTGDIIIVVKGIDRDTSMDVS